MKRRKIIYTIGLLIITALLLLTFQNSKIKGQKDYGQTNTDHAILVGEKDPNDQNNYDEIFSDIATAFNEAEADYETTTTIILTKDTSLDEDITIQSGQNIKVVSKDQDVVIGVTNRGYTLSIESTISLDLQSSLSFDCNVDLKTNGSIKANFEKTGDTFFLPRLEIYDSLNALGGSLNTDYFNSINVYGTINLTAGDITSSNEEENVALNIPLTLQGTNSGLVYTGGTLNTKIAGEGLVVTTNDTTTIDAPDTVMKIKAEVLTAESENNVELSSKTKGIYILDSTINYSLTSSLTLSDDLTLIALGDATITVGQNGYFNVSGGKTLNINGYLDGNSSSNTFYSIGANNLIIDGGITWEQIENGTYYFVTDSYEPGKGDAETFGRAKYSASGNTSSYPLIRVNGSDSTLNLYQNAVLQNRINTQSEGKSNNSGGAVALNGEAKDKRVNLNIIGANIRYNALPNVANSSGGAGIGAYNANIHMYSGSIDHNTVYKQAGFTEMENGQEVASTDGAGVSLIENAELIMEDGYISYNHGSSNYNSDGAGIMVRQSSNLDIKGGEVSYNFTYGYGGGICIYNSQVDISNGRIIGNRATYGGGIASSHEDSANLDDTTITLGKVGEESNLDVTSNTAFTPANPEGKATGYGGGVALGNDQLNNNQQLIVNDANIYNNTAIYGGGISAYTNGGDNGGRLYLRGGNISNNIAETSNNGNGIYVYSKGNDGINSLVYLSGSIKIDTSNNIVFADLDTLNNSQNDVISDDDWPKWENTNVIERDFNGLVHYKYQNLDVAKNNYHYLVINSDDRPNTSASAGYIFEITPYTDVTFHFNLIRPYDKGDSSTSFSIINKSNNTTVYTKNSLDSLGRRGLTGKWTPDSVQLMAGITYSIIASDDVAMKDISYSNATQTPIVVEDKLTATGAIGLITYDDSNQYSTHSTLAAYKNGEAQEDKFIIDNANYHVLAQGKAIKIVKTETDKNYIAEVVDLDVPNNKFTNLSDAISAITESSDTNFTIQILQNVNLTKEDFITIPTGKHVTITSAEGNRFTLNIPPEIEGDGSTIFTIENGASLTLSNIIYEGGASKNKEFVVVENNGTFTLESRAEINSNLAPDGLASIEIGRGKTTTEIAGIISKNEGQYGAIFIPFSEANVNITNGAQIYDNRYTGNITGLENIGEYVDIVLESGNLNLNDLTKNSNIGVIVKQGSGSINASNLANTTPIGIKLNGSYDEQTDTYANYYRNAVAVNVTDSNTYTNKFKLIAPNNPLDSLIKEEVGSDLILNMVLAVEISFSNAWNANEDKTGYIKGETVDVVSDAYDSFTDIKNIIKKLFNVDVNEDNYTNYLTVKVKEDTIIFYIDSTKQLQFSRFTEITSRASYYLNGFVQYEKSADTSNTYYGTSSYISVQNFSQKTNHINLGTVWEPNSYVFEFNAGGLSTALGEMENQTIYHNNFDDSTKYPNIDTNLYYAIGFYFKGWKVKAKTGFVQENREDLVIADGDQITPSMLSSITSQADGDTSFVFEAQWVSIFGDNNNDGFANISNVGTSSNNPFIIRDVEGLNVLADTISNDSGSYMVDEYSYYTTITVTITTETNKETGDTEEKKVVNKGYETNSYAGYYFKLADNFDNTNNSFIKVIGTIDYLGDDYFNNPDNKDPIYSDILNTQANHPFCGYFDGNKKTINVNINPTTNKDFVGLFGYTKNATITNLNIAGSVSGRVSVGGLVGLAYGGKISNIESDVEVSFTGINGGGIIGTYYIETENYRNGEVRHVINRGEVKYTPSDNDKKETEVSFGSTWTEDKLMIAYQGTRAGGIIGQSFHVQLIEAYNSGNVTARFGVGGIIGTMISQNDDISQDSVVNTAFNIGDVEATSGLGTDYQYKDDSTTIYQVNAYVGGIVGRMYGASTLSNSMNVGNVIASWRGTYDASDPNNVTFTYSATDPTLGGRGAGGIIGVTSIEIDTLLGGNKYISSVINTGKVKAWSHVGGIAGILAYSDVSYSINVGVVEADGYITYKEGNYAFTGAIVGLGIAANLSATVAFDGDLSYKTQTDSIIQAIGDNGDESVVFGYSANSSLAAKLSSSHLICQPNNSKPYGLSSTFFDTGWEWQSYDTKEIKYYYYPQLKSFSTATTIILKDNKSVSKISEEAVRLTIKDEAVTDQHKVTIILNLMNGSIRGHNSITINEDITFNYVDSENVWKAENIPYKNYQQEGKTLDLAEIEAVMSYPGYDFKGWYLDEDYTEPPFDGYISSQAVQTLYAKWVPHQYNINLTGVVKYSNGNVELSNNENLSYTIEDTRKDNVRNIILPTIKENSAYKYEYWRTTINTTEGIKTYNATSFSITEQDNGNYLVSFFINGVSSGQGTITKLQQFDFELYCSEINYDISFIYNNYTSNSNLTSLDGVTNPNLDSNNTTISFNINSADGLELASKPGYEFKGWFYEGQKVNTISEILKILNKDKIDMKDVKLEGRFEADTFKLILNLNGGTFAGATGDSVTLNINGENYIENYILERNNEGVWVIEVLYGTDITWLTKITLNHIKSPAGKTFIEMSSHIDTSEDILSKMPAYDLTVYANYKTQTYKIKLGVTSDAGTSINGLEFIELDENITIDNGTLSWENNTLYLTTEYGADLSDALKTIQNILNARSDTSYKPGGYEAKYDDKSFNYYNVKIDEKYNEISINFIYSQENFIVDFYDSLGNFIAKFETKGSQESWLIDNKIIVSELTNSLSTILAEAKYKVPTGYTKDNQYIIYVDDIAITITDAEISVVGAYTRIVIQLTAKKYSVKFETEGTEVTDTIKFTYNEPIAKLPDSNRDGYDLSGWEYNGSLLAKGTEFNEEHFSFDFDNSTEITLKARYEAATYNITYEFKADAYWAGNISSQSESVRYNDFEAIDLEEEFSDFEGYSFGSASYNNKDITNYIIDNTFLESLDQERNITITINLKIKTIYIIFNAGDGHFKFIKDDITRGFYLENYSGNITDLSDSSKHITEDNGDNSKLKYLVIEANYYQRAVDALHNRPILAGHTYSSYIAQDNNINMNTPLTNAQNIFNANYNADTYTITYIGEGITTTTTTAKYDQEITLSTPTRTGYKFEGWKIVGQTDGKLYKDKYIVKGNVVFEAEWQEKEFNLILTVEEKYRDAVLEALAKIDDSFISWPANNTFKIKFNTNLQELNRIETNNSLLIWKNDNVPYTFSTMPADKLELTAELNQREYVEITAKVKNEKTKEVIFTYHLNAFKQNNGKYKIESITEEFNRDGYSFNINSVNWYGNDIPTNLANAEFTSDTIIYAYATPDPYTIVYTTYEKGVLKTDTIIGYHDQILVDVLKNINRSRPGYESKNWTMNGIAVEDNKKITSNITVVADWTPVTYKIEFKYGDLNKTTGDFNKTTEAIEYDTVINQIPTFNELNSGKEEAYYSMKFMVGSVQWNDIFGDDLRMVALNDIQEQYPEEIRKSGNEYIITVTIELVAKNFTINFIGTNIGVSNFEEFSVTFNKESDFTDITKKISDGITTSTSSFNDIIHYKCLKFGDVTVAETYVFEDLIKLFENQYDVEVRLEYEAKKYNLVYNEHNPEFTINDKNVNLDTFAPIYSGTDDGKHYYFAGWYINGDTSQTLYNNIIPVDILLNYIQDDKVEIRPKYSPRKYGIIFYDKRGNSLDTSLPYGTKLDPNNLVDSDNLELDLVLKDNEGYYEFKGWEYNNIKYLFVDGKIDLSSLTVNGHMLFNAIWEAKEFTITYNNIDGLTNPNPSTITIETNPIELKPIAKLGYTFDGWYIGETVVTELKLKTLTDKDNIILEAKFTANTYKVSFDSAGGTVVEEQSYKYDDNSFTTLPTTEKDGYAFAGWYYGNIHIQTLEDIAKYAKDNEIKLTAVYEDNRYIIEFDYQYGELTDSNIENNEISLGYSDSFNLPGINNLNEDYQFLYWKVTINNVTTYYQAGQMISRLVTTGEVTFTAIYSYKVKLNDGVDTKFELDLVLDGTSVILPSLPDKEHYSFKGWVTKENDSNVYVAGEKYSLTKPLYAKYEPNTYTITYEIHDENNNEYHYDIVTYTYSENNQGISLKSLPTNSDLYEYDGWYLNDKKVTDINTIFGQNVTLYAKRKTNDITTTIIVNNVPNVNVYEEHLNDIKGDKANVEIKVSNTTVTVIFTTKYNETREIINNFFGSSYSVTSEGINYNLDKLNINLTTPSKNEKYELSFYTGSVKVTLYLVKGTSETTIGTLNELSINEDLINDRLNNIDKLGYEFKGWKTKGADDQYEDYQFTDDELTTALNLYAVYEAISYTISYNNTNINDQTVAFDDNQKVATLNADGQKLLGWSLKEGGPVQYSAGESINNVLIDHLTNEINLTANGNTITLYPVTREYYLTINFDKVDSSATGNMSSIKVSYSDLNGYVLPANKYELVGYTSTSWKYNNENITSISDELLIDLQEMIASKDASINLIANWEPNNYSVTYINATVTLENIYTEYTYGIGLTLLTVNDLTSRDGFTFAGWFTTSACSGDAVTAINNTEIGNKTYYAKWTPNKYYLKFEKSETIEYVDKNGNDFTFTTVNGEDFDDNFYYLEVTYGSNIPELPILKESNYIFHAWTYNNVTISEGNVYSYVSNIILNANKSKQPYTIFIDFDNGNQNVNEVTEYGASINEHLDNYSNISKTGYTLTGWYINGTSYTLEQLEQNELAITSSTTIKAIWTPNKYDLIIDGTTNEDYLTFGQDNSLEDIIDELTKDGYHLLGFTDEENGQIVKYQNSYKLEKAEDIALYPIWEANTLTIIFNNNNGSGTMKHQIVSYDQLDDFELAENTFTKRGHDFIGWLYNSDQIISFDNGKLDLTNFIAYVKEQLKNESFTIELEANWQASTYSITYEFGELTDVINPNEKTYTYGEGLTLKDPSRLGYTFIGWKVNNNDVVKEYVIGEDTIGDITLQGVFEANIYNITYKFGELTDVINPNEKTYTYGEGLTLKDPSRLGYTFYGWYLNNVKVNDISTTTTDDLTLEGRFTPIEYTISFNSDGGTNIEEVKYNYGQELILSKPSKPGYTFIGWYFNDEVITPDIIAQNAIDNAITLTALYEANYIKITITISDIATSNLAAIINRELNNNLKGYEFTISESNDGAVITVTISVKYSPNEDISGLNNIIKTTTYKENDITYTFGGYKSNNQSYNFSYLPTEDINITANYLTSEMVVYLYVDDNAPISYIPKLEDGKYSLTKQELDEEISTKIGYTLSAWYDQNGDEFNFSIEQNKSISLYVKFIPNTYAITLNVNGGDELFNDKIEVTYDSPIGDNLVEPTRDGYTFVGWYYNDVLITADTKYTYTFNIELTAQWEAMTYVITYETVGGSTINEVLEMTYDKPSHITNTIPTRRGYNFLGFATTPNAEEAIYNSGQEVTNILFETSNKTLYAVWEAKTYTISYQGYSNTQTFSYNEVLPELLEVSLEGNTFISWYYNNIRVESGQLLGTLLTDEDEKDLNITLVPRFEKNSYIVSFDTLGGTNIEAINVTYGDSINIDNPTKTGYNFISWQIDGDDVDLATYKMPDHNVKLVARYEIVEYNISYVGADYSHSNKETYTVKDVVEFEDATKVGYTFAGWYLDSKFETRVTSTLDYAKDLVLYAKFEVITYNISYSLDGGTNANTNPNSYTVEDVVEFEDATKVGYTFAGWYLDSKFETRVTSTSDYAKDLVLYAKFEVITYTITLGEDEIKYTVEKVVELPVLTKPGYEFGGWLIAGDARFNTIDLVGNYNGSAIWTLLEYNISYSLDGGINANTNPNSYTVEDVVEFEDATKVGYTFAGWYLDSKFETKVTSTLDYAKDLVLYAKFEVITYTITFDISNTGLPKFEPIEVDYGETLGSKLPSVDVPFGTTFDYWYYTNSENDDVVVTKDFVYNLTTNITLKPKVYDTTYYFIYNLDGGINNDSNIFEITLPDLNEPKELYNPTKVGYKFVGWYLDSEMTIEVVQLTKEVLEYANNKNQISLYAKYEIETYTIKYLDNDKTTVLKETEMQYNTLAEIFTPTKDGYIFDAWLKEDGKRYDFNTPITGDLVLIAGYRKESITYTLKTETEDVVITVQSIDGKGLPADAKLQVVLVKHEIDATEAIDLLANIGTINRLYDIKLVDSAGTIIEPNGEVRVTLTLPDGKFPGDGKEYKIMYINNDYSNYEEYDCRVNTDGLLEFYTTHFSYYAIVTVDKVIDYTWLWIVLGVLGLLLIQAIIVIIVKNRKYKITFISNGNIKVKDMRYKKDENVILPIPERLGYKFVGWYLDSKYTHPANIKTMPNENIILYARWKEDPITIGLVVKNKKTK